MSKIQEISGQRYVRAIIGCLTQKGLQSVTFEKETYDDRNDIPFCQRFQGPVDTVSVSEETPGKIVIFVDNDGILFHHEFDGSEGEDFDRLFHKVYYDINDHGSEEAEKWMEELENTFFNPFTEWLKNAFEKFKYVYARGIKVPATVIDDNGCEYDTLCVMEIDGKEHIGLTDSSNGSNNPKILSLDALTASQLLKNFIFILDKDRRIVAEDYNWAEAKFDNMENWAEEAMRNIRYTQRVSRLTREGACASYIYETLRLLQQKGINEWELKGDLSFMTPYIIHADEFLGYSIDGTYAFTNFRIGRAEHEVTVHDINNLRFNPDDGTTIQMVIDEHYTILCRPEGIQLGWSDDHDYLPEETVLYLEQMCQYILKTL